MLRRLIVWLWPLIGFIVLLLCVPNVMGATVYDTLNKAGGKIVLLDEPRASCPAHYLKAVAYPVTGTAQFGCWRQLSDEIIEVIWDGLAPRIMPRSLFRKK